MKKFTAAYWDGKRNNHWVKDKLIEIIYSEEQKEKKEQVLRPMGNSKYTDLYAMAVTWRGEREKEVEKNSLKK